MVDAVLKEMPLEKRPRLLFLACYFPPVQASGCVRAWNIAKHLNRLGWDVTVVTLQPSLWRHAADIGETEADVEREGIKRILTGLRWRWLLPEDVNGWNRGLSWFVGGVLRNAARRFDIDSGVGWIKPVEQACSSLSASDVDVILATGAPVAAFKAANRLSKRLGCPYVLDYRDPWTGNPHQSRFTRPTTVQEEARLLADCAAVTIVSPSWAVAMDRRFELGPKLHVVTNGYDSEELARVKPHDFGHFAIVYTGTFYSPKRVISPLLAALRRLEETKKNHFVDWYFHYFGNQASHVRDEAKRIGVTNRVILHDRVSRNEVLSATRGAGVAVAITSVDAEGTTEDRGIVTGKVFEAVGLGIPVLIIAPSGSDVEDVARTTGLGHVFSGSDTEGMTSFLMNLMSDRPLKPKDLTAYSWTGISRKLDAVLRHAARFQENGETQASSMFESIRKD